MVVDDNILLGSLLKMMLEDEGYEARSAGNGPEGYASYLRFRPAVVITDLHMPQGNGLELMKKIRHHDPGVKTIYMSGDMHPFPPFLDEEQRQYPVSLLPKPFSKEELLNLLAEFGIGEKKGGSPESSKLHTGVG
ncbi:MAG: response regulator [Syntrophaceae bacterium]|nr:response regulator [Syntrophaceae bacterium]